MKQNSIMKDTRGTVDSTEVVTKEEVIDVAVNPVSSLINRKSRELKLLMEGLLCSYNQHGKGETIQIKVAAHRERFGGGGGGGSGGGHPRWASEYLTFRNIKVL